MVVNKGARKYLDVAVKVASHPVRRNILKLLKQHKCLSTLDLEDELGESRYNLYHHISMLEKSRLIKEDKVESAGKLRYYKINKVKKPKIATMNYNRLEIKNDQKLFNLLFKILEDVEDCSLPDTSKIAKIEINLTYDWKK